MSIGTPTSLVLCLVCLHGLSAGISSVGISSFDGYDSDDHDGYGQLGNHADDRHRTSHRSNASKHIPI
eukprot:6982843-Pyramimonas_sp.AAC.1